MRKNTTWLLILVVGISLLGCDSPESPESLERLDSPPKIAAIVASIAKMKHPEPWADYEKRLGLNSENGDELIGGGGSLGWFEEAWDLGLGDDWLLLVERTSYYKGERLEEPILASCKVVRGSVASYKSGQQQDFETIAPFYDDFELHTKSRKGEQDAGGKRD